MLPARSGGVSVFFFLKLLASVANIYTNSTSETPSFVSPTHMKFSASTTKQLGHYVYALIDPRDEAIFYVGKASANNRAFKHLRVAKGEDEKQERIKDIRGAGLEPRVEVLRYGLKTDKESLEVEAAVIDALGLENLTNNVRGHGVVRGRQTFSEVERLHGSKPVAVESIREPLMLFFINKTYSPTMLEPAIYDCVRQFWSGVSRKTRTPSEVEGTLPYPIALAVVESIVVRAYSVIAWFTAGSTLSTRPFGSDINKWEFVGQLLADHRLVGRRLTRNGHDLPANQLGYGYIN